MTTITINKRTKAGKLLFEMAKLLSEKEKSVVITEKGKLHEDTKAMLDSRLKDYYENPDDVTDFETLLNEMESKL